MSAIKKFFEKKKADAKFKLAGKGQRLCDSPASAGAVASGPSSSSSSSSSDKPSQQPATQKCLTTQQRLAAEAALARIAKSACSSTEDFDLKRSRAAIRAKALKELEQERKAREEVEKLKTTYGPKEPVEVMGPRHLAVSGVFYTCSLIDANLRLPKQQMKNRIRQFLYEQLDEEPGLTAAIIIHTLNGDKLKVSVCVETLCKYLDNILQNPSDEKYRKIRKSNKAFQDRVAAIEGHDVFLTAVGFTTIQEDGQDFWFFPSDKLQQDGGFEHIHAMKDALISAEPVVAQLDRGLKVLMPSQVTELPDLPPDFFKLTAEDIKREHQQRVDVVERESMLRTRAMREKEQQKEVRQYRFTLIRVRFPDGLVLQGTFSVYEKLANLLEFVGNNVTHPLPFMLTSSRTRYTEAEAESTLLDLGLVPAVILHFAWHPDIAEEINAQLGTSTSYLKDDLLSQMCPDV